MHIKMKIMHHYVTADRKWHKCLHTESRKWNLWLKGRHQALGNLTVGLLSWEGLRLHATEVKQVARMNKT